MKTILLALSIFICANVFAQKNLTQVGHISYPYQLAGVWHYVDSTGHEYALVGKYDGVGIIDVANPANPVEVATTPGTPSIWREVKVWGHYAYVSTEGVDTNNVLNGIQIIDLSTLPNPVSYKFYTGDGAIANQLTRAHTVTVNNGYLYINGTQLLGGGVLICSLSDPWNPQYISSYSANYVHDCVVKNDTMWTSEIWAGQFSVVDITNKTNPTVVQTQLTPSLFNHNGWHSDDERTFFTTDEKPYAPMAAYDVSDLSNIKLLDTYLSETAPQGEVHNVRVLNDYVICANYASHVTIVDAARPDNLIEVAHISLGGTGLSWDFDPYFPSGILVASDMQTGLFVYNANYVRACYLEGIVTDSLTNSPLKDANASIIATPSYDSTNVTGEYKTGYADAGIYNVEFSVPGYKTKTISNVQLTNGVVTNLNVQLVPLTFSYPELADCNNVDVLLNNSTHQLTISKPQCNKRSNANLMVFDAAGKLVLNQKVVFEQDAISFNLAKGLYIYQLLDESNTTFQTGKISAE